MSERFATWKEAHTRAVLLARSLGREIGILRTKEYGRDGFNVLHLPKRENRYGFELSCEIVSPTDPL
jgi:hypothetical protein